MSRPRLALAIIMYLAGTAFAQAPVPVAERVVTGINLATRVTLFSNHVVVVSERRNGKQDFLRHITLPADQYLVYLVTFQKGAEELGEEPISSSVGTSTASVQLTLHVGPEAPRLLRFLPWPSSRCRCHGSWAPSMISNGWCLRPAHHPKKFASGRRNVEIGSNS